MRNTISNFNFNHDNDSEFGESINEEASKKKHEMRKSKSLANILKEKVHQ
jgi:hypothetical protein